MTLRQINIIVGLSQIGLNLLIAIPSIYLIFRDNGGGFGFGYMVIPIISPLALCSLFGLLGLFNYQVNYKKAAILYVGIHILVIMVGIASFLFMPIFPFTLIGILVSLTLIASLDNENFGLVILSTNALVILCLMTLGVMNLMQ